MLAVRQRPKYLRHNSFNRPSLFFIRLLRELQHVLSEVVRLPLWLSPGAPRITPTLSRRRCETDKAQTQQSATRTSVRIRTDMRYSAYSLKYAR